MPTYLFINFNFKPWIFLAKSRKITSFWKDLLTILYSWNFSLHLSNKCQSWGCCESFLTVEVSNLSSDDLHYMWKFLVNSLLLKYLNKIDMTPGDSGVRRKKFRGVQGYGRLSRGCEGRSPRTPENFRKCAKMQYFRQFCKEFQKPVLNFLAFGRKTQFVGEILRNFEDFWWKFKKLNFIYFGKICC